MINWWKGTVTIQNTLICENVETGIFVKNTKIPMQDLKEAD